MPIVARGAWPVLAALSLVATALAVGPSQRAVAADVTDGLTAWYKLGETTGTVAADSSGNGRNATVNGRPGWGPEGLTFNGTDTYVKLPDNLLRGLTATTIAFDVRVDPAQSGSYFLYGIGNSSGANGNGYLFATGNNLRTAATLGNWSGEQNTQPSPARALARGVIKHLVYTQTGSTGVLYEDGLEVGRNTGVTVKPGDIGAGTTTANYLGRSLYSGDGYLAGTIRDFRIYDRALSTAELGQVWQLSADRSVQLDRTGLDLGDTSAVTADLRLPTVSGNGSALTWASSNAAVVGTDGKVTRPASGRPDATVTLNATIRRGASTATKSFNVTVLAEFDDSTKVGRARDAITVPNLGDVRGNLTLPTTGAFGTSISWKSANPQVIANDGVVHRPAPGSSTVDLNLIATVTLNQASASRTFQAKVPARPVAQPLKGYLFSYFTGEAKVDGEQIYNAVSKGNDPLRFREVNGGKPVLTSTLGTKGLRDPFIIRSPDGDKFYQIATDLRIHGNGNWDASQRTGSKSIMVWESTDLVNWTDQRLVKVSPDTAGNTWAPEAFYDDRLGSYVVFWASKIYAANDPGHTGTTYNKMMYTTTRDFHTFSPARVWKDPGYSVIDSTVVKNGDTFYRFTKDERNNSSTTPCSKFVIQEKSTSILSEGYDFVAECLGKGVLGAAEGPLVFKSNTEKKWYLFLDEFGGRGYVPFESTDLDSGVWTPSTGAQLPPSPRHGTVLPVTQAEYDSLLGAYTTGLVARYEFEETSGTVVRDTSGAGNNATYQRGTAFGTGVHGQSAAFDGGPGDSPTARYVSLPTGILTGSSAVTVSTFAKWSGGPADQWLFGLGSDRIRYLFATPANGSNQFSAALTKASRQGESKLPGGPAMTAGRWTHVAVTLDATSKTAILYVDGREAARATGVAVQPSDLDEGGYLGRSLYPADPFLAGQLDDFRIYDRALSAAQILTLSGDNPDTPPTSPPPSVPPSPSTPASSSPPPSASASPSRSVSASPSASATPRPSASASPRPSAGAGGNGALPRTGDPIGAVAGTGLAVLLAGLLLVLLGRRRRT